MRAPNELRRCRAVHGQRGIQCEDQVTEATTHIADHHAQVDGMTLYWTDLVSIRCICPEGQHPYGGTCWPEGAPPVGNGSARLGQVGGTHYAKHKIQPWDVWDEYDLDRYTANAVKYLLRGGDKPGNTRLQDLKKARHYLDKAIEMEEGGNGQ